MLFKKSRTFGASAVLLLGVFGITAPSSAYGSTKTAVSSCITSATYKVTAKVAGWLPTNQYTASHSTPYSFVIGNSKTYLTAMQYSGSVSISTADVVSAANSAFTTNYANPSTVTMPWDWYQDTTTVSSSARMLVLHRADKVTFTKYQDNPNCTTTTYSGLVAYIPVDDPSQSTYCSILDFAPNKTTWSATCVD